MCGVCRGRQAVRYGGGSPQLRWIGHGWVECKGRRRYRRIRKLCAKACQGRRGALQASVQLRGRYSISKDKANSTVRVSCGFVTCRWHSWWSSTRIRNGELFIGQG